MKRVIKIISILFLLFGLVILFSSLRGNENVPDPDSGMDKTLNQGNEKIDVEKKYNLDFEAFNLVLDSTCWVDVKISYSARTCGWNYYFVQPDTFDYLEIQLDESPKIIKTNPFDGLWIDVGTPEKIRIRGSGVIQFVPNHPFY